MNWNDVLPEAIRDCPAVNVIDRSLKAGRLGHALLIQGEDLDALEALSHALAAELLGILAPAPSDDGLDLFGDAPPAPKAPTDAAEVKREVERHPDRFVLRPAGKSRTIQVEPVREMIREVSQSPNRADRKAVVILEADRLNATSQNILLKTLEEPPLDTTLMLLTTRPYALLDTIRSRCLHFRVPAAAQGERDEAWASWLDDYAAWIMRQTGGIPRGEALAQAVIGVYGLASRFGAILETRVEAAFKAFRDSRAEGWTKEELEAAEVGLARDFRRRLLREVEIRTRDVARSLEPGRGDRALAAVVADLEQVTGLLEANLAADAALEHVLLRSLRHWLP